MLERGELRGTKMGPNGSPNAKKESFNRPRNRNYRKKQAFWIIFVILGKTGHLAIMASHFRIRVGLPEKVPHAVLLK